MKFPLDLTQTNEILGFLNGTLMRGATVIPGLVGNAVYIDGNRAYVDFGTHTSGCFFSPSQCNSGMTVSFWLKMYSKIRSSFVVFVDNGGCTFAAVGFCVWGSQGVIAMTSRNERSWFNARIPLPSLMKWNFVTGSITAGTMTIFINGCYTSPTAEDAGRRAVRLTRQIPLMIGSRDEAAPHFAIDDIRVWYNELNPKEVWGLYSDANGNSTI